MDNTAQSSTNTNTQNQTPLQQVNSTQLNQVQPQTQTVAQPAGQIQVEPVSSSFNKEQGISTFSENIKPSEEEPKIQQVVQDAGVTAVNTDKPNLDEIHEKIGVSQAAESTPVKTEPTGKVTFPITEEEAEAVLKTKSSKFNLHENVGEFAGEYTEDSMPFLAALVVKVFKEMHKKVFRRGK